MAMERIVALATVIVLGGCDLYTGDDAPADVDAGAGVDAASPSGLYAVRWECLNNPCESPIAVSPGAVVQAMIDVGQTTATIAWVRNGDPTAVLTHVGVNRGDCVTVSAGTDSSFQRDAYELCLVGSGMGGVMAWNGSRWNVTLDRL